MNAGLIYELTDLIKSGNPLAKRNWPGKTSTLFMEDAARVVLWFTLHKELINNEVFLVAGGEQYPVGQILDEIKNLTDNAVGKNTAECFKIEYCLKIINP